MRQPLETAVRLANHALLPIEPSNTVSTGLPFYLLIKFSGFLTASQILVRQLR